MAAANPAYAQPSKPGAVEEEQSEKGVLHRHASTHPLRHVHSGVRCNVEVMLATAEPGSKLWILWTGRDRWGDPFDYHHAHWYEHRHDLSMHSLEGAHESTWGTDYTQSKNYGQYSGAYRITTRNPTGRSSFFNRGAGLIAWLELIAESDQDWGDHPDAALIEGLTVYADDCVDPEDMPSWSTVLPLPPLKTGGTTDVHEHEHEVDEDEHEHSGCDRHPHTYTHYASSNSVASHSHILEQDHTLAEGHAVAELDGSFSTVLYMHSVTPVDGSHVCEHSHRLLHRHQCATSFHNHSGSVAVHSHHPDQSSLYDEDETESYVHIDGGATHRNTASPAQTGYLDTSDVAGRGHLRDFHNVDVVSVGGGCGHNHEVDEDEHEHSGCNKHPHTYTHHASSNSERSHSHILEQDHTVTEGHAIAELGGSVSSAYMHSVTLVDGSHVCEHSHRLLHRHQCATSFHNHSGSVAVHSHHPDQSSLYDEDETESYVHVDGGVTHRNTASQTQAGYLGSSELVGGLFGVVGVEHLRDVHGVDVDSVAGGCGHVHRAVHQHDCGLGWHGVHVEGGGWLGVEHRHRKLGGGVGVHTHVPGVPSGVVYKSGDAGAGGWARRLADIASETQTSRFRYSTSSGEGGFFLDPSGVWGLVEDVWHPEHPAHHHYPGTPAEPTGYNRNTPEDHDTRRLLRGFLFDSELSGHRPHCEHTHSVEHENAATCISATGFHVHSYTHSNNPVIYPQITHQQRVWWFPYSATAAVNTAGSSTWSLLSTPRDGLFRGVSRVEAMLFHLDVAYPGLQLPPITTTRSPIVYGGVRVPFLYQGLYVNNSKERVHREVPGGDSHSCRHTHHPEHDHDGACSVHTHSYTHSEQANVRHSTVEDSEKQPLLLDDTDACEHTHTMAQHGVCKDVHDSHSVRHTHREPAVEHTVFTDEELTDNKNHLAGGDWHGCGPGARLTDQLVHTHDNRCVEHTHEKGDPTANGYVHDCEHPHTVIHAHYNVSGIRIPVEMRRYGTQFSKKCTRHHHTYTHTGSHIEKNNPNPVEHNPDESTARFGIQGNLPRNPWELHDLAGTVDSHSCIHLHSSKSSTHQHPSCAVHNHGFWHEHNPKSPSSTVHPDSYDWDSNDLHNQIGFEHYCATITTSEQRIAEPEQPVIGSATQTETYITITLHEPVEDERLAVAWSIPNSSLGGTATRGDDYRIKQRFGTFIFQPGEITKTIPVTILSDRNTSEPDETIRIELSSYQYYKKGDLAYANNHLATTLTIVNTPYNPPTPANATITTNRTTIPEPQHPSNGVNASFTITLKNDNQHNTQPTIVYWNLTGTARQHLDYTINTPQNRTIIPPREQQATINLTILPDTENEPDETITIRLRNNQKATLTITNTPHTPTNPSEPGEPSNVCDVQTNTTITTNTPTIPEPAHPSNGTPTSFTITLQNTNPHQPTVICWTATGTATQNQDYTINGNTNQTTIPPGQQTATINLTIHSDTNNEPNETITITLTNTTQTTPNNQTTLTITPPPQPTNHPTPPKPEPQHTNTTCHKPNQCFGLT